MIRAPSEAARDRASKRMLRGAQFRSGALAMLPISVALSPFGVVCGVAAANAGFSVVASWGLSAIVFSGAAQIIITELFAADAPIAVIVATCIVVSLRLALYSAAVAPHVQSLPARWRNALAYVVTDQVFAGSIQRLHDDPDKSAAMSNFLGGGAVLWLGWQVSCTVGFLAGQAIPPAWSLDFAVPLCFVAVTAPLLREAPMIVAATVAAAAVVALDFLPMRLNLVSAGLAAIVAATIVDVARERSRR